MSKYNSKCPLNCNKKGCGTHLCQRYADYQQGRADQKKEDNEFFNFDKVIEIEKNKSYQQGAREFADRLKSDAVNGTGDMEKLLDDCVSLSNSSATFLYVNYIDEVLAEYEKEQYGNP